jgi:hypothetical protein
MAQKRGFAQEGKFCNSLNMLHQTYPHKKELTYVHFSCIFGLEIKSYVCRKICLFPLISAKFESFVLSITLFLFGYLDLF